MKCEECSELLTSLVFEELSEEQSLDILEHMADCENCREEMEEAVKVKNELDVALNDKPVVEGLSNKHKQKIMSAVGQKNQVLSSKTFPSWVFALAACIVIGLIVGVKLSSDEPYSLAKSEKVSEEGAASLKEEIQEAEEEAPSAKIKARAFKAKDAKSESFADEDISDQKEAKLDRLVLNEKNEAKKSLESRSRKIQPAAEFKAMKADAAGLAAGVLNIDELRLMLADYLKMPNLSDSQKVVLEKLKSLKNDQIQMVFPEQDKGAEKGMQKILLRILNKAEKAIDYAHIIVHNRNIIQVERVR